MIFSSKPPGVTTWIFFENRFVNLLKTVSMYWRICLPKAPALGTTRHEPQLAAVQGLARTSMSASFSAAEGYLTSRSFTGSRPCGVFTKTTISLPSSFLRVPSLFFILCLPDGGRLSSFPVPLAPLHPTPGAFVSGSPPASVVPIDQMF